MPTTVKFEHRIGVTAPGHVVWELLADLKRWPSWNPIYSKVEGQLAHGAEIHLTAAYPGQPPESIATRLVAWTPDEMLHLRRSLARGWVTAIRYFEIENLAEANCILSNGELYSGWLAKRAIKGKGARLRDAFRLMNEALKAKAEAVWRDMPESRIERAAAEPKKKAQPDISLHPAVNTMIRPKLKSGGKFP